MLPLITHSSPSRTARVWIAATSEPAPGSVTAIADTISPAIAGTRNCCFSSSLPNWCSEGVAMSVWTLIPIATPALSQRPISSNRIAMYE